MSILLRLASPKRYPELDVLRSLAIIGMIIYHGAYDLVSFYAWNIDIFTGPWKLFERSIALTFLLLVGISPLGIDRIGKRRAGTRDVGSQGRPRRGRRSDRRQNYFGNLHRNPPRSIQREWQ